MSAVTRLSRRQKKRARVRARRQRDLQWLSEHPEAFGIKNGHVIAKLRDYGNALFVGVTNSDGATLVCWIKSRAFRRRTHRNHLARCYGMVFNNWLAETPELGDEVPLTASSVGE